MRYAKGWLTVSRDRDQPLLKQLATNTFATQGQLFEFMQLKGLETSRRSFDWRLLRLARRQLVHREVVPGVGRGFVYSLTLAGAQYLDGIHEDFVVSLNRRQDDKWFKSILHSVELNSIQLTLLRAGVLAEWIAESAIASRNELTYSPYVKYYDAVVKLVLGTERVTVALEYERTKKAATRYEEIAAVINQEKRLEHFLYLVPSRDLLHFVSSPFRNSKRAIYFGLTGDLHKQVLQMPVFSWRAKRYKPFTDVLREASCAMHREPLLPLH